MRTIVFLLLLLAVAQEHALAQCTRAIPANAQTFVHEHRVSHFNGDPPSLARDELAMWSTAAGQCFALRTVGSNYHECDVRGALSPTPRKTLEFRFEACSLTFDVTPAAVKLLASPGWDRSSRGGTCTQYHCGMHGSVKSGTFQAK